MRAMLLFACHVVCSALFASATQTIVSRFDNFRPLGREIEIKNIDFVRRDSSYLSSQTSVYHLDVYVWVRPDLITDNLAHTTQVMIIDANDEFNSHLFAHRIGTESDKSRTIWEPYQGYAVYQVRFLIHKTFSSAFYARWFNSKQSFYSNFGRPNDLVRAENIVELRGPNLTFRFDRSMAAYYTSGDGVVHPLTCEPLSQTQDHLDRSDRSLICRTASADYWLILSSPDPNDFRTCTVFQRSLSGEGDIVFETQIDSRTPSPCECALSRDCR